MRDARIEAFADAGIRKRRNSKETEVQNKCYCDLTAVSSGAVMHRAMLTKRGQALQLIIKKSAVPMHKKIYSAVNFG